jgi:hypothetical protein
MFALSRFLRRFKSLTKLISRPLLNPSFRAISNHYLTLSLLLKYRFFKKHCLRWDEIESTWYVSQKFIYCTSPGWRRIWNSRSNANWQGKPECWEKNCLSTTLSTTNPTWFGLGSNLGCRSDKATNRFSFLTLWPVCGQTEVNFPAELPRMWQYTVW